MHRTFRCQFCPCELDPAQQFTYLVEVQTVNDPIMMRAIRKLPHHNGRPLRVCKGCQTGIEERRFVVLDANRIRHATVQAGLALAAAVGLWAVTARVGNWLGNGVS